MKLTKIRKEWRPACIEYFVETHLHGRDFCFCVYALERELSNPACRRRIAHQLRRYRTQVRAMQRAYDTRSTPAADAFRRPPEPRFQPGRVS